MLPSSTTADASYRQLPAGTSGTVAISATARVTPTSRGRCWHYAGEHRVMNEVPNDSNPDSAGSSAESRLLTVAEAVAATGLSRKVITGRMDRGTLRTVKDDSGTRRVPRAELQRAGLLDSSHPGESANKTRGELVIWRELYERERDEHEATRERLNDQAEEERRRVEEAQAAAAELREQLAAIANAGPIRAMRLRRELRARGLGQALADRGAND